MSSEEKGHTGWERTIEILEVVVLAVVAIATAWSGYQASKWGGRQSSLYGQASTHRFEADAAATLGGQQLVADSAMFTSWLQAHVGGDQQLEAMLVRRFSLDYRVAFHAWLKTDPFEDPNAPPGPGYMPNLRNKSLEQAERLNSRASALFERGTEARDVANKYVRDTVLFATVLFLVAIGQRFQVSGVRMSVNFLAMGLLIYTLSTLVILPRI